MKKIIYLTPIVYIIILVSAFIIGSCSSPEPQMGTYTGTEETAKKKTKTEEVKQESYASKVLKGDHKLAFIKDNKYLYVHYSPNYSSLICSFIWKTNEDFYSTSYIYFSDVRFIIDPDVTEPYIKFNWNSSNSNSSIKSFVWNSNYMVVVTNDNNFQKLISYASENSQIVSSDN